jgi:Fur family ferric uptake transcriptional regulator
MSHSEVVDALAQHTWDPSTLYRNLSDLAEAGLLRRSELGDRTWRFEVSCDHGHADHTAHFLCRDCGVIACLPELIVTPSGDQPMPFALTKGDIEVQILGRCDECSGSS